MEFLTDFEEQFGDHSLVECQTMLDHPQDQSSCGSSMKLSNKTMEDILRRFDTIRSQSLKESTIINWFKKLSAFAIATVLSDGENHGKNSHFR